MAKNFSRTTQTLFGAFFIVLFMSSCYNKISEQLIDSDIPIRISSNIKPPITRVTENQFETNDAMGFFLIPNGTSYQEAFISNCKFQYHKGRDFMPEKTVYYPKTDELSSIFCYYPYNKDAFSKESGKLHITLPHKQDTHIIINNSDFLTAFKREVLADIKPQKLSFKHQLSKIKLVLKPSVGYSCEEILSISPQLMVNGIATTAFFDPVSSTFSDFGQVKMIKPLIDWKIENERISGCEFLAIPQSSLANVSIQILAEGITYTCSFPEDFVLEPSTVNTVVVKYTPSKGIEILNSESSIEKWEDGKSGETEAMQLSKAMSANQFNFDETNVIQLINSEGQIRGEVYLEYLKNKDLSTQAVVVYPMNKDGKRSTKGLCLKTLSDEYYLDGCFIEWNERENTFLVEEVNELYKSYFFISTAGELLFEDTGLAEQLHAKKLFMYHEGVNYPVVKVGADVWLASNLRATKKIDGSPLAYDMSSVMINAGYTTEKDYPHNFMYNKAAIASEQLVPSDWLLASEQHWVRLFDYIAKDFGMLKSGELWSNSPANNMTYFNMLRTGCYTKGKYFAVSNAFWIFDSGIFKLILINDHAEKMYEFREISTNDAMASIRCIRN